MNFTNDTDRRFAAQVKTLETRLCEALENNGSQSGEVKRLLLECNMIFSYGAINKSEHKALSDIKLYCEMLDIKF